VSRPGRKPVLGFSFYHTNAMLPAAAKARVQVRRRSELSVHCALNSIDESRAIPRLGLNLGRP
jgi:hypothetical protein